MYNVSAPTFPEYIDDEYHHLSSIRLPAFAGMQITNGPYGSISEAGASTGDTHRTLVWCRSKVGSCAKIKIATTEDRVAKINPPTAEVMKWLLLILTQSTTEICVDIAKLAGSIAGTHFHSAGFKTPIGWAFDRKASACRIAPSNQ